MRIGIFGLTKLKTEYIPQVRKCSQTPNISLYFRLIICFRLNLLCYILDTVFCRPQTSYLKVVLLLCQIIFIALHGDN